MKSKHQLLVAAVLLASCSATSVFGQAPAAPSPSDQPPSGNESAVILNPFQVNASESVSGYRAKTTVAGTMIAEAIDDLPLNISPLTSELISDSGATSVEGVSKYVAGVGLIQRNEGAGGGIEKFSMRGFSSTQELRDGLQFPGRTNTADIEEVEILRGANSILFGAAAPGGLVNYTTKQPQAGRFGDVSNTYGRWYYDNTVIDFNQSAGKGDWLKFRVIEAYTESDDWRPLQRNLTRFFNPMLTLDLPTGTRILYNYQNQSFGGTGYARNGDNIGLTLTPTPANGQSFLIAPAVSSEIASQLRAIGPHRLGDYYKGIQDANSLRIIQDFKQYGALQIAGSFMDDNSVQLSQKQIAPNLATLLYQAQAWKSTQGAVYAPFEVNYTDKIVFGPVQNRILVGYNTLSSSTYERIIDGPLQPAQGVFDNESFAQRYAALPPLVEGDPNNPAPILNNHWVPRTESHGIYGTDEITIGKLNILVGTRYAVLNGGTHYTPQYGAIYKIVPGFNAYVLYSESYVENGRSDSTNQNSPFLPPQLGKGEEAGFKFSLLDGLISGSLDAFKVTQSNIQETNTTLLVQGLNSVVLSGQQESKGVEFDAVVTPAKGLEFRISYAYNDAHVTKDVIATSIGLPLEGSSPNNLSINGKYTIQRGILKYLDVGGAFIWRSGPVPLNTPILANAMAVQPGYTTFDGFLRYPTHIAGFLVTYTLSLTNLTNKWYLDRRWEYADPFNWRLKADLHF